MKRKEKVYCRECIHCKDFHEDNPAEMGYPACLHPKNVVIKTHPVNRCGYQVVLADPFSKNEDNRCKYFEHIKGRDW